MQNMQGMQREYAELQRRYNARGNHLAALGQDENAAVGVKKVIKDFYVYEEDFNSIGTATSQTGNINIQADSDFLVQKLTYFATLDTPASQTDATRIIPLINVVITDTGSGRNLMESAVPVPNLFGTGEIPFILPQPKLFLARSTISIVVSNFSTTLAYDLQLSFIGYKIFRL